MDKLEKLHYLTIQENIDEDGGIILNNLASESAKITQQISIQFAEWLRFNCNETSMGWQITGKDYTDEEIFQEFLKQYNGTIK